MRRRQPTQNNLGLTIAYGIFFVGITILAYFLGVQQGSPYVFEMDYNYMDSRFERQSNDTQTLQLVLNAKNMTCNSVCDPSYQIHTDVEGCYNTFENIIYSLAEQKEYELNVYDCSEFAKIGATRLNELGWTATDMVVTIDCDARIWNSETCTGKHAIIRVYSIYIEAVTGKIIHPDYYKMYGIK